MTTPKLPWRPGGAKGGEMLNGNWGEALCVNARTSLFMLGIIDARGPNTPADFFCYTGEQYPWTMIDRFMWSDDLRSTIPTEGESNGDIDGRNHGRQ